MRDRYQRVIQLGVWTFQDTSSSIYLLLNTYQVLKSYNLELRTFKAMILKDAVSKNPSGVKLYVHKSYSILSYDSNIIMANLYFK